MILLWLDLETTGLDARKDFILECAWTFTDDKLVGDGVITSRVISPGLLADVRMDAIEEEGSVACQMHKGTGLWDELREGNGVDLRDLEQELVAAVSAVMEDSGDSDIRLAGASVHFDLGFIRQHMPELAGMLSHRVYDTSTLKVLASSIGVEFAIDNPHQHRAAADVLECLVWAMSLRNIVAPAPKLDRFQTIAGYRAAQQAFEGYVQNLREMSRRPGAGRVVTIEGLITALRKSARSFGDQADLALLHLDD